MAGMSFSMQARDANAKLLHQATTTIVIALLLLYVGIGFHTAWICDDAYITFRTVDNFVHGYGLRWNPVERVETYTHPLWMLLISGASFLTREIYLTTIILSILISVASAVIFSWRIARSRTLAILGMLMLIRSNAFTDYTTSGLENPLTYLLLALFFGLYFHEKEVTPKHLLFLSFFTSLGGLSRMDTLLLYAPMLIFSYFRCRSVKGFLAIVAGFLPFLIWESFSFIYYGFPFPNTAYAKLCTGIPKRELFVQGLRYFLHSIKFDPLTALIILFGIFVAVAEKKMRNIMISAGIVFYLIYIVRIGGDFMSGRFLTAPFFCSVLLVSQSELLQNRKIFLTALAGTCLIGYLAAEPSFLLSRHGIIDERRNYYVHTGLLQPGNGEIFAAPAHEWIDRGKHLRRKGSAVVKAQFIGMCGYYAGPQVHIVDINGLSDPLLARLPARYAPQWGIGHFQRIVPDGYIETIRTGANRISDKNLAIYYDALSLLTRGPLFSHERLKALWAMNTGAYDHLIDYDGYRYPDLINVPFSRLDMADEPLKIPARGAEITLPECAHYRTLQIQMERPVSTQVEFMRGTSVIGRRNIWKNSDGIAPAISFLSIPRKAAKVGFDKLRIFPANWKPSCVISKMSFPKAQPQ